MFSASVNFLKNVGFTACGMCAANESGEAVLTIFSVTLEIDTT